MIDYAHDQQGFRPGFFHHVTIETIRQQADNADTVSEHTLNPEQLWRRSTESWHHGAGQVHFDRKNSDPWMYRSSKGMNPWTQWQISSLHETVSKRTSSNTNLALLTVNARLYLADGSEVYKTAAVSGVTPTWTATNVNIAEGAQTVQSITTDGYNLYAALGTNGIHTSTYDATVWTHYGNNPAAGSYYLVSFVKGRLMAASTSAIYNLTASGAAPAALFTHPNSQWTWTSFAEGQNVIYASGFYGTKSTVYRITIRPDGTALDVPVPAAPDLPTGEIVRSIYGYLGYVLLGTDKGVRFCTADSAGNLNVGPFISTPAAVSCFDAQDRFVYFGYTNYDSLSTGLGRLDLTQFTNPLVPAYASDVMAGGGYDSGTTTSLASVQGAVLSTATFESLRVFAVSGVGVYQEGPSNLVPIATLDSGLISYGIVDDKVSVYLDTVTQATQTTNPGSFKAYLAVNNGTMTLLGTFSQPSETGATFPTNEARGELLETRIELDRDATDATHAPVVSRQTLRVSPAPARGEEITVPLLLHEIVEDLHGGEVAVDVNAELAFLQDLAVGHDLVTYQEGSRTYSVFVESVTFLPTAPTLDYQANNGVAAVLMKSVPTL
jgi:hypothetical protein